MVKAFAQDGAAKRQTLNLKPGPCALRAKMLTTMLYWGTNLKI